MMSVKIGFALLLLYLAHDVIDDILWQRIAVLAIAVEKTYV